MTEKYELNVYKEEIGKEINNLVKDLKGNEVLTIKIYTEVQIDSKERVRSYNDSLFTITATYEKRKALY